MLFLNMISLASIDRYSIALMLKMKKPFILVLLIVKVGVTNNAYEFNSRS